MTNLIIVIFCVQRKCRCAALHKVCGLWLLSFEKETQKKKLILVQRNETQTLPKIIENHYHCMFSKVTPTKCPGEPYLGWGSKIGNKEDKKISEKLSVKNLRSQKTEVTLNFVLMFWSLYPQVWTRTLLKL